MKKNISLSVFACLIFGTLSANTPKVWNDFVKASKKNKPTVLLDFSYAGYHRGEKAPERVNHKIFNICDYGAIPNDHKSDRFAFEAALRDAEANGSGVIYLPKGRFLFNEKGDKKESIFIRSSNIVIRGEGSGYDGTEIYMKEPFRAPNPREMWTSPLLFSFNGRAFSSEITQVSDDAARGTYTLKVKDASMLKANDWVTLRLSETSKDAIKESMKPYDVPANWTSLWYGGLQVYDYRQIKRIKGNTITFFEPIMVEVNAAHNWYLQAYPHISEVGVEDIAFVGNFKEKFVHHKDDIHDGGWKFIEMKNVVNSWIRRCRFTDVSQAATLITSANSSLYDCTITGNSGHHAATSQGSSRIFIGAIDDTSAQWHSVGITKHSVGTVIWRVETPSNTCFESHSSQPRATLFDVYKGGFMRGRCGGAIMNNPNHMRDMVFWNYHETDQGDKEVDFWPKDHAWFRFLPPVIVGFHGAGTTFKQSAVAYEESNGKPVEPESLYEAQLKLRLGKLPSWISELRDKVARVGYCGAVPADNVIAVNNNEELYAALKTAKTADIIELADGDYADVKLISENSGSFYKPIIIKAKNPGKVTFSGDVRVEIRGNHTTLSGIQFKNGNRKATEWKSHGPGLVAIYGDYCVVEDCLFHRFDEIPSAYITTSLDANGRVPQYAHIRYCAFIEKSTFDQVVNFNNTYKKTVTGEPGIPMYHRLNNCYFSNPKKKGNAGGGIRVGYWRKDYGRCLIDNNLFERQDSEAEIITSKSMENVYYNNTFVNCQGTLNFRHGDKQVAINNFFIGTDEKFGYGGMYVWGSNHIIGANYFQLTKTLESRGNSAIYFNIGETGGEHALAFDMSVINNTFIGTNGSDLNFCSMLDRRVEMYKDKVEFPYDIRFVGNRFFSEKPRKEGIIYDPKGISNKQVWVENLYNGVETGVENSPEGLKLCQEANLRIDDSKIYVEDVKGLPHETVAEYLPYTSIEGIDLNFYDLIKHGLSLSPCSRSQVGPRWCKDKMPTNYAETGIFDGQTAGK